MTGSLEVHNSVRLKYCPKRCHFSYKGMVVRNMLAVMDHNENTGRMKATTQAGMMPSVRCTASGIILV